MNVPTMVNNMCAHVQNPMKRKNLIIFDGFLENPDAVREYALEQQFERLGGKNWPGRDSSASHGEKEMTQACSQE